MLNVVLCHTRYEHEILIAKAILMPDDDDDDNNNDEDGD